MTEEGRRIKDIEWEWEKKKRRREREERKRARDWKKEERVKKKNIILIIHPCYSVVLYTHTYCGKDVKKIGFKHPDEGCFYEFSG